MVYIGRTCVMNAGGDWWEGSRKMTSLFEVRKKNHRKSLECPFVKISFDMLHLKCKA